MTRTVLGEIAKAEIIECIGRCHTRGERSDEVARLAAHYGVSKQRIYEVTKAIRPIRKTRSDKGRRSFDVDSDTRAQLVYGWIDTYGISTAEAVNMARENGIDVPIGFSTLNRYLREDGLGKKQRRSESTPHRRFEAKAPGDLFQFDISGLKTRWFDRKTRRIVTVSNLEVSKNHPNANPNRVKVWRFSLIDDFSRRIYLRYYAVDKPNSTHVVDFLLRAYSVLGVPIILYTDNDSIIVGRRTKRSTEILNKALRGSGGYELLTHLPGNARATGKVERLHQTVEQEEKLIGIYLAERGELTIDVLNEYLAVGLMNRKNNTVHSETNAKPMDRWHSQFSVVRSLDYDLLHSAFMADDFTVKLRGDCTIRIDGQVYQLPTTDQYPFADWAAEGRKIHVVFPDEQNFFTVVDDDLNEYDIRKVAAVPDVAGEFRSTAETRAQRLRKTVRAVAREDAKSRKLTGEYTKLSYFDKDFAETGNVARFPKTEMSVQPASIAEVAPGRVVAHDPALNFWEAFSRYEGQFASRSECKAFMDSLFPSRDEAAWLLLSEIEAAFSDRRGSRSGLRAVG